MGNPRLPSKIKLLKGTYKKARENSAEPDLGCLPVPAPPSHLEADAQLIWLRLKPQVDALGIYTDADYASFQCMVVAFVNYEKTCMLEPRDQKDFISASKEVRGWLQDFGMTPASRARVRQLPGKKAITDVDEFFS